MPERLKTKWRIGASIKEPERMELYLKEFRTFELDINRFESNAEFEAAARRLLDAKFMLHTIHLKYHYTDLNYGLSEIERLKHLQPKVFVFHLCYPKNDTELKRQIAVVAEASEKHNILIALENLADRSNKSRGYMKARDPIALAAKVKEYGCNKTGITLDTSHAICNQVRWWSDAGVAEKLMHVHLSGGTWGEDMHYPVSTSPIVHQLSYLKTLLSESVFKGMVSLENFTFEDMKASADALMNRTPLIPVV